MAIERLGPFARECSPGIDQRMTVRIDHLRRPLWSEVARVFAAVAMCVLVCGCHLWSGPRDRSCNNGRCQDCAEGSCSPLCCISCEDYTRCVDEKLSTHEAVRRANRSLRKCYASPPSFDFKDGYRRAFVDVALGGAGELPAVPPERYWSSCYRTAAGHQRAQAWYAGYVAGAARALAACRYQPNEVLTSGVPHVEADPALAGPIGPGGPPSRWADESPPPW